jgi:hypothetical protein
MGLHMNIFKTSFLPYRSTFKSLKENAKLISTTVPNEAFVLF